MLDIEKVEKLRQAKGLTMQQAADAAGIKSGKQGWNNLVTGTGNVRLLTLDGLAKAFGCDPCELLKRKRGAK